MSAPNGHAQEDHAPASGPPPVMPAPGVLQVPTEQVKELVAALEVPFDSSQIEWRVMNTTKNQQPMRGQVVPYADQRAYTDRLNALFTPAGWTRRYAIHTSGNFERSQDKKIVAKVLVSCELTIFGLGSHSATGEEFADDPNALTAAEAQAFKRAAVCFGLGRYLYYFTGTWVDLDDRKRPKSVPQLAGWATPAGWQQGLRPSCGAEERRSKETPAGEVADSPQNGNGAAGDGEVVHEIERMQSVIGKRMYRGLLKSVARVWNPKEIPDRTIQRKVLEHMHGAERGLLRAQTAREKAGLAAYAEILGSMKLSSVEQINDLKTLQEVVMALEQKAGPKT